MGALSSRRTRRWQKILIGIALVLGPWAIFTFLAFVPFSRATPIDRILYYTIPFVVVGVGLLLWKRLLDVETFGWAFAFVAAIVLLFLVPVQGELPAEARQLDATISAQHEDRHEYARALFLPVATRFSAPTRQYMLEPHRVFLIKSVRFFWETDGYVPSHIQAQLFRRMLLNTERFAADEVDYRIGRCFMSPHGYLHIAHPERPVYADPWAATRVSGYQFGQIVDMPACSRVRPSPPPYPLAAPPPLPQPPPPAREHAPLR